jgi:hypothetical protein
VSTFLQTLKVQRWDDHRYYHLSRINQALHLVSAISFLVAYAYLFIEPPVAALIAWLVSMVSRQSGHFFFEPKGYDHVNQATHEYKEAVKVGYNLQRKVVLMAIWAALPVVLWLQPDFFGLLQPHEQLSDFVLNVGWLWLWLGVGGLLFRMAQLVWLQGWVAALAWVTKILTDPVHDILLYWKSPWYLLQGEWLTRPEQLQAERARHEAELARQQG